MATLRALSYFDVVLNGRNVNGGSRSKYKEFTVGEPYFDETKIVAFGTTWDAWGFDSEEPISDFDFLYIESNLAGTLVELTCDANNGVGREEFVLCLGVANFPLVLGSKVSRASHAADFSGGSVADVIDAIRINNPHGSTDATVRVCLFT